MTAPCPIFGFVVELQLRRDLDGADGDRVGKAFTHELLEGRGLVCGPAYHGARWSFVVQSEAGQATEMDREAILAWARGRAEIGKAEVGPLIDRARIVPG